MKKSYLLIALALVAIFAIILVLWVLSSSSTPAPYVDHATVNSFSPDLVKAKQDCQAATKVWEQQNPDNPPSDSIFGITAHFSSSRNACLMEFTEARNSKVDNSQSSKVVDLIENRVILELDIELPGSLVPTGEYLYADGQKISIGPFGNALNEYTKRRDALFQS